MSSPEVAAGQTRVVPPANVTIILSVITIYGSHLVTNAPISQQMVVGGAFVILALAVTNTVNPGLADMFSLLLFIVIFLKYGVSILTGIGIATQGS